MLYVCYMFGQHITYFNPFGAFSYRLKPVFITTKAHFPTD